MGLDAIHLEINAALASIKDLIAAYERWNDKRKTGQTLSMLHSDLFEFVNLRVETAETCALLIEHRRVADALGLCRSLLEHVLLMKLLSRGDRYFQLAPAKGGIEAALLRATEELDELHAKGERNDILYVAEYPGSSNRQVMYVLDGLRSRENPADWVSYHYFAFQRFRPATMRLDEEDYASYIPSEFAFDDQVRDSRRMHRREAKNTYQLYLSYGALLTCLGINDLVDAGAVSRIDAHYTFLGQFLHPTHDAARSLHVNSNHHMGGTQSGLRQQYDPASVLLSAMYVIWLLRTLLEEICFVIDRAPSEYFAEAGTSELHLLLDQIPARYGYFWFVWNEAPLWDKYNHAVVHATDEQLRQAGGFAGLGSSEVKFDYNILGHFKSGLTSWSNLRVGNYRPPFA